MYPPPKGAGGLGMTRVAFDLSPETYDAMVEGAVERLGVTMSCGFQQPVTGERAIRIFDEQTQQLELARAQFGLCAVGEDEQATLQIEHRHSDPHFAQTRGLRSPPGATQERLHARHQLARFERFDDIVVSTGF